MVDVSSGRKVRKASGKADRPRGLLSGLNPAVFGAPAMLPALNPDVSRLSLIPTGDTRDTGHAPPVYSRDPKEQQKYLAQRRLRGVSDLVLGAGDLTNMAVNAGLRDVGYFAGKKPDNVYQFPMPSQAAANLATEATGARIVPEETMPWDVRQRGANQQALMGMLPVGPEAVVGPALGILPPMMRAVKGGKVAKAVEEILPEPGGLLAGIKAYHGSPHSFPAEPGAPLGRFRDTAIGTGEGAQAYGRGHYIAEQEGTARTYKENVSASQDPMANMNMAIERLNDQYMKKRLTPEMLAEQLATNPNYRSVSFIKDDPDALRDFHTIVQGHNPDGTVTDEAIRAMRRMENNPNIPQKSKGHMYEVEIAADPEHFLDWDKPLSEQHPVVQEQLRGIGSAQKNRPLAETDVGRELYYKQTQGLSNESATERLKQAGIPGIRYLDQGSRGAGEGTKNYVVFDPAIINIVRKYGLAAAIGAGIVSEEMGRQMQAQGEI